MQGMSRGTVQRRDFETGLAQARDELFGIVWFQPLAQLLTSLELKIRKQLEEFLNRSLRLLNASELSASSSHRGVVVEVSRQVDRARNAERFLILVFAIVLPEMAEAVPPRVMRIQGQSFFRQSQPTVPIPRIGCQQSHPRLGAAIQRVQGNGPLACLAKGFEIFLEETRRRKTVLSKLAGRIESKRPARCGGRAPEGIRTRIEAMLVLFQIHQRERSPRVGIVWRLLDSALQAGADDRVLPRRN